MDKMELKARLAAAGSFEKADQILEEETTFSTFAEKKAFLAGLFECKEPDIDELTCRCWLEDIFSRFQAL